MFDFHQAALCFLIRILSYDPKYKDVFREVGVLEVLTNCLKQYAEDLKEKYDGRVFSLHSYVEQFGQLKLIHSLCCVPLSACLLYLCFD